jgi:hypothetical protein
MLHLGMPLQLALLVIIAMALCTIAGLAPG